MRLKVFFKGVSIVLAVAFTQMAAAIESSTFTQTGEGRRNTGTQGQEDIFNKSLPITLFRVFSPDSRFQGTTLESTLLIAQQTRTRRIRFAPGAVSDVVEDSVVRGTRDIYLLRARKGQTMTLTITSLEQNAVFDVQAPNGNFIQEEAMSWSGVLPATGDYSVIVGGTRGNATYKLEVTIQ
ncbi:MAG: hypothetical protein ICV63_02135 [Coleofasciculus sp. Co-bin14]|nr:hypothetical protein [Coleofasciculus sp. Co-bin14]